MRGGDHLGNSKAPLNFFIANRNRRKLFLQGVRRRANLENFASPQGSKNLFCASRRIVPGAIFLVAFFLSSRSQSCAMTQKFRRQKEKEAIFEAIFCTHPDTNIINEMIASSFYFGNEN